jgi:hypothetical protein
LQTTGQSTGLTAADVAAIGGPAAGAAFTQQQSDARLGYSVTRGLAGLPLAEQNARVESLKPKGGEPDFARRQTAYQLALQTLATARNLQATDPATATQASEASAALWRNYASTQTPEAARTWATDTLNRQAAMGVPESQRRILPVAEARRIAGVVKNAQGPDILNALNAASAMVAQFGGNEGQILTELSRAGLDAPTAAIIGQANGNPAILQDYARARARGNTGLTAEVRRQTRAQVVDRLGPLLQTWAPLTGGQAGTDALVTGIETMAGALVADGLSPDRAARQASQQFLDGYRFNNGWRIPRAIASGDRVVAEPVAAERMGNARRAAAAGHAPQQRTSMSAVDAAELGALRVQTDFVRSQGAGLYAAGTEPHLSDVQKRTRMADIVANRGRWISTLDDGGLMLVQQDPARPNAVIPILGADGQPIRRTWGQLFDRAARPTRADR